jgi:hypothetical protein
VPKENTQTDTDLFKLNSFWLMLIFQEDLKDLQILNILYKLEYFSAGCSISQEMDDMYSTVHNFQGTLLAREHYFPNYWLKLYTTSVASLSRQDHWRLSAQMLG